MNLVYRIVWSQVLDAWVAVSEIACAQGKSTLSTLVAAALALSAVVAQAGPIGAVVASGSGSIAQSGTTTTVNQTSPNLSLTWKSFNVAPSETVNFVQPSATAVAVNRIYDTNGSQIMGRLNANGQVYLINPNGVLFGPGAQINVGALVASTLDFNDASLGSQSRSFSGTGNGSVVNLGAIEATGANGTGGFVALLGNSVSNQGSVSAPGGTVALGAGSAVTLTFQNSSLVQVKIDQSVLDSQSANGGVIRANGGRVLMSAGAQDALLASVVNNTGVIEARTVENHAGSIVLLGGMAAGTTHVGGTLDASAPNGGNGGFIETSAAHVKLADTARITTAAPAGKTGTWLIDPVDFTIAATGGDITGAALGTLLDTNSVTVLTDTGADTGTNRYGTTGTNGDIFVNDPVSWSASNTLTLNAHRNININRPVTATSGKLELFYGQGSTDGVIAGVASSYNVNAPVNLSGGQNFSTKLGTNGIPKSYTVITSLGVAGDTSSTSLQGMHNSQGTLYALGADIDASDTINWNGGLGFMPVNVGGALDGLGHVVSNLTINRPAADYVGMISATFQSARVSNIGLSGGSITGKDIVGGLIGMSAFGGVVSNSFSNATVTGETYVGGLVGYALGSLTMTQSYNSGAVTGYSDVGGLIGHSVAGLQLSKSFNLGQITTTAPTSFFYGNAGGLVGSASGANIEDVFNLGRVQSTNSAAVIGGVVGDATDNSMIQRSYNNGVISGRESIGGISGYNRSGSNIYNSYNLGSVYAEWGSGGITGYNYGGTITNSFNSGAISSGVGTAGAIVGNNYVGIVIDSYWNSNVASRGTYFGNPNWGSYNLEGLAQNVRALSSDEMKQSQNYTATLNSAIPLWDFNIWYASGSSAPILRSSPFVATANFGQAQTYGSVNTAKAISYANMWGNDSFNVSGLNLNTNATETSGVGNYPITGSGASATNLATGLNYFFIYSPGTLTINQRPLTVTAEPKTKNYGDVNPALSYSVAADGVGTSRGLVNGDSLSGSLSTAATQASSVGSYTIDASALSNGNYVVTANNGTLTISAVSSRSFAPAVEAPQTTVTPRLLLDEKRTLQFTQKSGADMNVRIVGAGVKLPPETLELYD